MFGKRRAEPVAGTGSGVPATWLAWPTLRIGGGQIKTAGVTHYEAALRRVRLAAGPLVMAELRVESEGQYEGAVRVFVDGEIVGSIPHDLAEGFRVVVDELAASGLPATCRAQLDVGEYLDVWLDARPAPRAADDPFLPPFSPSTVRLGSGQAERLDEGLHSTAKSKRIVVLGQLMPDGTSWQVMIDGTAVGVVEDDIRPGLYEAQNAGFPLTCQVRILRESGRPFRVVADLPPAELAASLPQG